MTSEPLVLEKLQSFCLLPESKIKSPGSLLKLVKTEFTMSTTLSKISTRSQSLLEYESSHLSHGLQENNLLEKQLSFLLSPTQKKILKLYNINTKSSLNPKQTLTFLSYITQELSKFPYTFIEKLKIEIVLSDMVDINIDKNWFYLDDLQEKDKVINKLYSLMFDHLIVSYSDILNLWMNNDTFHSEKKLERGKKEEAIGQMESSFYALMQNRKYPKNKSDVVKMKDLLMKFDPEGLSDHWFKEHKRDLVKTTKVSFSNDFGDSGNSHHKHSFGNKPKQNKLF